MTTRRSTRRNKVIASVALGSSALLWSSSASADARPEARKSVTFTATLVDGQGQSLPRLCAPELPDRCAMASTSVREVTGDLQGRTYGGGVTVLAPQGGSAVGAAAAAVVFVGTVNGCGSGSFMYLASATGTLPMDGKLIIVEGSGTGDLEGISGKATSTLTISPSQTYQGKIRCPRS